MNHAEFQTQMTVAPDEAIDLRQYWRTIMRYKYGIAALGVMAAIVSALFALRQPDIFDATATLLIEANQASVVSIDEIYNLSGSDQDYMETQSEMLRNRSLAEMVIRDLNLLSHPVFSSRSGSTEESTATEEDVELAGSSYAAQQTAQVARAQDEGWRGLVPDFLLPIADKIIPPQNTSFDSATAFSADEIEMAIAINRLQGMLDVNVVDWTNLLEIRFTSGDPRLASDLANSLAENFIQFTLNQRVAASQSANLWLSESLQSLRDTLNESEARLQQFMEEEDLIDVDGVSGINTAELNELTGQSAAATQRRSEAEARFNQVSELTPDQWRTALTIPAILNDEAIRTLKNESDAIDRRAAELSKRYGRRHPQMIALRAEQESMEENLRNQVVVMLSSIENEYLSARDVERNIVSSINQGRSAVQDINRKSFTLRELQREVETNRELYDMFFTRIRETDETEDFEGSNIIVVDPAVPALGPSGPNRQLQINIATLAALMLGVLLALLRDAMDNTVKTAADVEERLKADLLGVVPKVKIKKTSREKLAYLGFSENPQSSFSEAFRTIRTGIMLSSLDAPARILEVASTVSGEGKSTVAFNLAAATAQTGSTLIIDADLRRPSIARSLGIDPSHPGITDMLVEDLPLEQCSVPYKDSNITIMPAGQKVANPLEVMTSKSFGKLLMKLAKQFDTVVIDTPPINSVSDALVLAHLADHVVYVVNAGSTPIKGIRSGIARLRGANASSIGVVLNQVDTSRQSYYGENEYYGGYYNTNVYGESATMKT